MYPTSTVGNGKVVPCQPHSPPSKFWVFGLAFLQMYQGTVVSNHCKSGASHIAVELLKGIYNSQKFPISGTKVLLSFGAGPGGIADDMVLAIFLQLF